MGKSLKGNIRVWSSLFWSLKPERKWVGKNLINKSKEMGSIFQPCLAFLTFSLALPPLEDTSVFQLLSPKSIFSVCSRIFSCIEFGFFFFPFLSVFEFLELRTTWACVCVSSLSGLISRGGNSAKCCAKRLLSDLLSRVHTMFPIFFMRKVKLRQVNGTPPKVR